MKTRDTHNLEPFTYEEFLQVLRKDNKMALIFKTIRDIDQENNGYVTTTELEDIIKIHFPQLANKRLKPMFKPYASIQNRILIDYRLMKNDLVENLQIDLDEERKIAFMVHPKHTTADIRNVSNKRKKTKLNSLTVGNLAKIDSKTPRTLKTGEDDDVISHVSISKASFHSKPPGATRTSLRASLITENGKRLNSPSSKPHQSINDNQSTHLRQRVLSNQSKKRVLSPLQKSQFNLEEVTSQNKNLLFSPQRTKTPLMQNYKKGLASHKNFKVLNMNQLASNQKNEIREILGKRASELDISRKTLLMRESVQNVPGNLTSRAGKSPEGISTKPIPAMLYNSKKQKQSFGFLDQFQNKTQIVETAKHNIFFENSKNYDLK